jgi:maltose O-acetyltransferase
MGAHALILKGVTIGDISIVGAGVVVTKDFEVYTIVAGNPATKIRDTNGYSS